MNVHPKRTQSDPIASMDEHDEKKESAPRVTSASEPNRIRKKGAIEKNGVYLMIGSFVFAFVQIPVSICGAVFFVGLVLWLIGRITDSEKNE